MKGRNGSALPGLLAFGVVVLILAGVAVFLAWDDLNALISSEEAAEEPAENGDTKKEPAEEKTTPAKPQPAPKSEVRFVTEPAPTPEPRPKPGNGPGLEEPTQPRELTPLQKQMQRQAERQEELETIKERTTRAMLTELGRLVTNVNKAAEPLRAETFFNAGLIKSRQDLRERQAKLARLKAANQQFYAFAAKYPELFRRSLEVNGATVAEAAILYDDNRGLLNRLFSNFFREQSRFLHEATGIFSNMLNALDDHYGDWKWIDWRKDVHFIDEPALDTQYDRWLDRKDFYLDRIKRLPAAFKKVKGQVETSTLVGYSGPPPEELDESDDVEP